MNVFVVALAESNEHLPEYPRGTQGNVIGVYTKKEDAINAMNSYAQILLDSWNEEEDDIAHIDEEMSDEESVVIMALDGDVAQIIFVKEREVE